MLRGPRVVDPCAACGGTSETVVWGAPLCSPCAGLWYQAAPTDTQIAEKYPTLVAWRMPLLHPRTDTSGGKVTELIQLTDESGEVYRRFTANWIQRCAQQRQQAKQQAKPP